MTLETVGTVIAVVGGILGILYNIVPFRRFVLTHMYIEMTPFDMENFLARVAIGDRQLKIINGFLRAGIRPNSMDRGGITPLIQAVNRGQIETVRLLLKKRADPNLQSGSGTYPLVAAILSRNKAIEDLLIKYGAKVEVALGARLILAVTSGDLPAATKLIEEGASLETCTVEGNTCLMEASNYGHAAMVDLLLKSGARVDAKNLQWETALMLAARNGHMEIVNRLVQADPGRINFPDKLLRTALLYAQEAGHTKIVAFLRTHGAVGGRAESAEIIESVKNQDKESFDRIIEGANLDIEDEKGTTILTKAVENERIDFVETMIAHGVTINAKGRDGRNALHVAAELGYAEILKLLLDKGADPNLRDKKQNTPLLLASQSGWLEIVKLLLEHGANRNDPGLMGETPLLLATENGHTEIVKVLIPGAELDRTDMLGRTPLMASILEGYENIEILLRNAGATRGEREAYLLLAATRGNEEEVARLIKGKVNLNVQGRDGRSALHIASGHGYGSIVRLLLDPKRRVKTEIDAEDLKRWTALMLAASKGQQEIITLLLASHANVNTKRGDGTTALMDAIEEGHIKAAEILINHSQTDLNAFKKDGRTALHIAVEKGQYQIVDMLTNEEHRATIEIDASTSEGITPLMIAILNRDAVIEKLLRERGATKGDIEGQIFAAVQANDITKVRELARKNTNLNIRLRNGRTPLILAAETSSLQIVKTLVEGGADINLQDNNKATALSRASYKGRDKIVAYLCNEGASVDVEGREKKTPLILACEENHPGTARTLVAAGADVDAQDEHKCTPLMIAILSGSRGLENALGGKAKAGKLEAELIQAAQSGDGKKVKTLIQKTKIHLNASCKDRMTALLHACRNGQEGIVKMLLDGRADVHARASDGNTSITLAAQSQCPAIIDLLLRAGALIDERGKDYKTALIVAAEHGNMQVVQKLLDMGANPNAKDKFGSTALIEAAGHGHMNVVNLLIERNTSVNVKDNSGETALLRAAKQNKVDVMCMLLDHNADPDTRDQNNATALIHAADAGYKEIVEILINRKADVNAEDRFGNTPLMNAILAEKPEIVQLLLDANATKGLEGAKFIIAVIRNDLQKVEEYLQDQILRKEVLNKQIRGGDTPLILALKGRHTDIARKLLEAGADVDIPGKGGRTALITAVDKLGDLELVRVITEKSPRTVNMVFERKTASIVAEEKGYEGILKLLVNDCKALPGDRDVFVTLNGNHYHLTSCFYWSSSCEKKTLRDALKKDLLPCSHCVL